MTTPDERHIRKTELWKRDDRNNDLIQRKANDSMKQVDAIGVHLNTEMNNTVKLINDSRNRLGDENKTHYDQAVARLSGICTETLKKLGDVSKEERVAIDKYIAAFQVSSKADIKKAIADRLDIYQKTSKFFNTEAEKFRQGVAAQMTKYQAETLARYNLIKVEVDALKQEIKKLRS